LEIFFIAKTLLIDTNYAGGTTRIEMG